MKKTNLSRYLEIQFSKNVPDLGKHNKLLQEFNFRQNLIFYFNKKTYSNFTWNLIYFDNT